MTPSALHHTALQTALSELLRVHAPQATLLASLGDDVLRVRADNTSDVIGHDLVPPDDWFTKGEMTWLTRDGALLGLLWSEDGQVPPGAVQVLTMLLAAARVDGANREAEVLVTQLPMATAWITGEMLFRKVSRPFLEMFGLSDAQVVGKTVDQVFPDRPSLLSAIQAAVAGRSVRVPDELFRQGERERWLRGEARPYFGGTTAGVMMTLQDVTGEYERASRVAALLDTDRPAALLTESGVVLQASQGLLELAPPGSVAALGTPLWAWPCFADAPSRAVSDLVKLAASGGAARADVELVGGGTLPLSVRRTSEAGLLVAEGLTVARDGQAPLGMISEVLALSDDATILVDHAGRAQLVSERAAQLLGVEAARLVGLGVTRVLGELGIKAFTPSGEALTLPDWREVGLPYKQEVLLATPDGLVRHMELRATAVGESATSTSAASRAGLLLIMRDLTALRRAQAKMRHAARHDSLTSLMNRIGLREVLSGLPPQNAPGAVISLDIDGFGALNAALGRTACDRILIQVAAWLNDLVAQRGGHAARLADDTFAVTLPGLNVHEAAALVREQVTRPLRAGGRDLSLSVTLGAAPTLDSAPEAALGDAEIAMQYAKAQGQKGQSETQVSVFNASMRDSVASAFELAEALRGAVPGKQFTLLYQPAINLRTGQPVGAEALLRWNHPTLGVLPPNQFLEIASRSDLITQVSEWVVQAALQGRKAVRAALPKHHANWRVAVNLGLEELRRSATLGNLLPLLHSEGAPDIEVSAGSLLDHSEETLGLLEQLRALGAHLSVDDFGEGASSLSALTRFPLHALKLHPTLTAKLPGDEKSVALVQGTIDLAHRLGLSVTAVGVETEEQLRVLRELGCDAAQGYAIAPPMSAPDLLEWLNKS